ncbi:MAG TPA: hypothetical protein VE173_05375 [Longimicrobiales bacterium]|nr:hypothetical protein [Longimicrobiales bacterium]
MKPMRIVVLALTAAPATVVTATPTLAQTGPDLIQQALVKEQAEGDLQGAIVLYELHDAGLATNLFAVSPDGEDVAFAVNDLPGGGGPLVGAGKLEALKGTEGR